MNLSQEQYDVCAFLCESIYNKNTRKLLPTHKIKKLNGLCAEIFEFDDETYICFSGTNGLFGLNDWICNFKIGFGIKPKQYISALEFVSSELDQNKKTIFCGHSLGGFLTEAVCNNINHDNFVAVVFNGAGSKHIVKEKYQDNIYHFITNRDILNRIFLKWFPFRYMKRYFKHIGDIVYVEDKTWSGIKSHSNFEAFRKFEIK